MAQRISYHSALPASSRLGNSSKSISRCVPPFGSNAAVRSPFKSSRQVSVSAVLDVTETTFEADVLKADLPVLVDFWATWCGPCKLVAPSMVWAEKEFEGKLKVVKIDCTDSNKGLMEKYKVYGLPCLIVFRDGEEVAGSHREGAITRKDLGKYIEQHVGLQQVSA